MHKVFQIILLKRILLILKPQRDLWEGAKISLNWKVGWGMNKSTRLSTDEFGNITIN